MREEEEEEEKEEGERGVGEKRVRSDMDRNWRGGNEKGREGREVE